MSSNEAPLSALAQSLMENDVSPSPSPSRLRMSREAQAYGGNHAHEHAGFGVWSFIFGFLVLALIFYFLFFALRPSFVLENSDCSRSKSSESDDWREISQGRLLGAAVLAALVLLLVLWLLSCLARNF